MKGQGIYAYVTLNSGQEASGDLAKTLKARARKEIGPIATPDAIQFAPGLPKTRSGKIMRRILRKIAEGDTGSLATRPPSPIRRWWTTWSPIASADRRIVLFDPDGRMLTYMEH
ncbi:AMP-binding enzyme [Sphingomonas sp. MMS24-JH45]